MIRSPKSFAGDPCSQQSSGGEDFVIIIIIIVIDSIIIIINIIITIICYGHVYNFPRRLGRTKFHMNMGLKKKRSNIKVQLLLLKNSLQKSFYRRRKASSTTTTIFPIVLLGVAIDTGKDGGGEEEGR